MTTQRYSVTPHPIETLLTWVKSGEIAIPEIQRGIIARFETERAIVHGNRELHSAK